MLKRARMSRAKSLAKNTLLIAISKISTQLVLFFMLPLYTATLSTSEYGAVDLIITYGGLFAPLIMLNVQQAVFRYLIDARSDNDIQRKIITNAVEIIFIVVLIALAAYFSVNLLIDIPFAKAMAFYFASFVVGDLILQVARGLGWTKAFAIAGIAQGVLTVILNLIFMTFLHMGADGMLLGMAIGSLIPAIVLSTIIGIHRSVKLSARDRGMKKRLLAFSLPLIPNTISWWVFNASDRTIVSMVLGLAANGIYAVTNKFSNIANSFSSIFYMSWSEASALAINDKNRDEFFSEIANITLKVFSSLGILIMSFTPIVFPILVDENYKDALLYLPILVLGTILNTIVSFYSAIYVAKKLTKQVMNTSIIAAVINLAVNFALIWRIGIWAAAVSTVLAYGAMAVYRHYDMKKYVVITYNRKILFSIITLYATVTILYYTMVSWANVSAAVISLGATFWLNRHEIVRGKLFIKTRLGIDK